MGMFWFCFLVAAGLATSSPPDPGDQWELVVGEARQHLRQGRYLEAERCFRQALRLSEAFEAGDARLTVTLGELAVTVRALGRLRDAERLFLQAVDSCERLTNLAHVCLTPALGGSASVYVDLRQVGKAETLLRRALSTITPGENLELEARLHYYLAAVAYYDARYEEAERLIRRALDLSEKAAKPDIPQQAALLANLAVLKLYQGDPSGAVELFRKAIETLEPAFGPVHPLLAKPWSNLAVALSHLGRSQEAVGPAFKAKSIAENAYGPEHFITARVLMQSAAVLRKAGRAGEARRLEKRAQAIVARHESENSLGYTLDFRPHRPQARLK